MPATGCVDVDVDTASFDEVGSRCSDVWDGEPEAVYVPTDMPAQMTCVVTAVRYSWLEQDMRKDWLLLLCARAKSMLCSTGLMKPSME